MCSIARKDVSFRNKIQWSDKNFCLLHYNDYSLFTPINLSISSMPSWVTPAYWYSIIYRLTSYLRVHPTHYIFVPQNRQYPLRCRVVIHLSYAYGLFRVHLLPSSESAFLLFPTPDRVSSNFCCMTSSAALWILTFDTFLKYSLSHIFFF